MILCSCSVNGKIYLENITELRVTQINAAGISAQTKMVITNDLSYNIEVLSIDYELFRGKQKLGVGSLDGKITIARKSSLEYEVPLRLVLEKGLLSKIPALLADHSPLELQAVILVKTGLLKKRIKFTQIFSGEALGELFPSFGL